MCTASVIRFDAARLGTPQDEFDHGSIVRLAFNRDELITRPTARSPEIFTVGQRRAVMPVDPVSQGTWIAINDAGLVFAMLNRNARPAAPAAPLPPLSRGTIIPQLLHCASAGEAKASIQTLRLSEYSAFRLLMLDAWALSEFTSDGRNLRTFRYGIGREALMFTSSGLGDPIVGAPRRELMGQFLRGGRLSRERQDLFHRHRWPERPHISVCMNRADARTVSYTAIEVSGRSTRLVYRAGPPDDESAPTTEHVIELRRRQAA